MKPEDYSFAIGKNGYSSISSRNGWSDGDVATPYGYVTVYAQGDDKHRPHSRLDFIYQGRQHVRSFNKRFSHRGLAMKAKQFAREIVAQYEG